MSGRPLQKGGTRNIGSENTDSPIISVVTVCFNAASTLGRTIASLSAQTDQRFEYIVIDGGSQDGTLEILMAHEALIDTWISAPDGGIFDAMNKGAELAKGRFIAFLNADDHYLPDTVETVIKAINNSEADVYHGNMEKERIIDGKVYTRIEKPNPELMPSGMGIFHPSSFVSTSIFRQTGGFDTRYKLAADYDFFLKLWLSGKRFHYIDKPLSVFSLEGASNAGCGTYAEAVKIQAEHDTGTHKATRLLLWKCRTKKLLRNVAFRVASFLGMQGILRSRQAARWKYSK